MFPIHSAALGGNMLAIRWLVENMHASASVMSKDKTVPMQLAAKRGRAEAMR